MAHERDRREHGKWVVGGAGLAALLFLLLRRGSGFGGGADGTLSGGGVAGATRTACRVRIDQAGIELDGVPADLATTVAGCRAAGVADVTATGAAIVGTIAEVVRALQDAGVDVRAALGVWDTLIYAPGTR